MNNQRIALGRDLAPSVQASISDSGEISMGEFLEFFGGGQRAAGINVTPDTAMRSTTVWRCTTLIAGALMSQELGIYELTAEGDSVRVYGHPYERFLTHEPNDEMSAEEFVELQAMALLLRGNGYGLIRQARNGTLTSIDWYNPVFVSPFRSTDKSIWYRFTNVDGTQEDHHASYVLHFRGPGRAADGIRALSPIAHHAQAVGINMATRDYEAGQFERGLMTNDFFTFPAGMKVSPEQRAAFKEYLRKKATGVANAHNPLILENGAEWKRVSMSAKDAQLLELLQYSAVDLCRIWGVPPHMAGEVTASTSWGTGIEQQNIGFDRWTVLPHKVRIAGEYTRKLFPAVGARIPKYFVWWNDDFLKSGDSKAIAEYLRAGLGGNNLPGWLSQNDARRAVNQPPKPGGDKIYSPPDPATAPPPPAPAPAAPEKDPADES